MNVMLIFIFHWWETVYCGS